MILSIEFQTILFLKTVVLGMAAGLFYDFFRTLRCLFKHPNALVSLEDILYWLVAAFFVFLYMLDANDAEIRPFCVFGIFIGMVIYFSLPSKGVMAVSGKVADFIHWIVRLFFEIVFMPFRVFYMIFGGYIRFLANFVSKIFKKLLLLIKIYVNIRLRNFKSFIKVFFKKF